MKYMNYKTCFEYALRSLLIAIKHYDESSSQLNLAIMKKSCLFVQIGLVEIIYLFHKVSSFIFKRFMRQSPNKSVNYKGIS